MRAPARHRGGAPVRLMNCGSRCKEGTACLCQPWKGDLWERMAAWPGWQAHQPQCTTRTSCSSSRFQLLTMSRKKDPTAVAIVSFRVTAAMSCRHMAVVDRTQRVEGCRHQRAGRACLRHHDLTCPHPTHLEETHGPYVDEEELQPAQQGRQGASGGDQTRKQCGRQCPWETE